MKNKLPGRATTYLLLVFLSPLILGFSVGSAERDAVELPPNAHLDRSGRGWECDRGYRKSDDTCVAVEVPPNAYLDSYAENWKCKRGYRKSGNSCAPVEVPANAHLGFSGRGWACDPGYRREGVNCISEAR